MFHNSNVFGSCIIHILYTGRAKIKKYNSAAKRLNFEVNLSLSTPLRFMLTYLLTYKLSNLLTPWSRYLLENLPGSQLRNSWHFMDPKGLLPHSQILSQFDASTFHFLMIHLNIIFPSKPRSSKWFFFLRFSHQNPVYTPLLHPIRAKCSAHLIYLDLIAHTIFGGQ